MNYDVRLDFGVLLTPTADDPQEPVALARLAEQLDYDVVTVGDRPYLPELTDAPTLLSWIAAVTDRIRVAVDVHSLPLRDPVMLARAVASLDHLSGGRVELGVGAGADQDAVKATGGPLRSTDEAVAALDEAIDVVHELWGRGESGPARYEGRFHQLRGAGRAGPAHEVPIVVDGVAPDVLRLIGRKADGWSVTLEAVGVEGLRAGNATIDAAARAAGRDPREIRRQLRVTGRFGAQRTGLLEGSPADWVRDLVPLVVEHGVGTLVLASDDAQTLTRFAEEVIPAVRSAVDDALPHGSAGTRVRKASVLAARHPGIDYDHVPASLAEVVEPGDLAYPRFSSGFLRGGSPGIVLRAAATAQVVDALAFARRHPDLPLSLRSAGHGISGRSTNDGRIVLDVSLIDHVEVPDVATRRVAIGPGARWLDVATALDPYGWALTSGDDGGVGVGRARHGRRHRRARPQPWPDHRPSP